MKRYKTFIAVLLTIFSLGFIVFVGFMQQQFNNPDFNGLSAKTTTETEQTNDEETEEANTEENDSNAIAGAAGSMVDTDSESENQETETDTEENTNEEAEEVTTSTRTVTAETLNARSGPGVEYDVAGVLVLNQVVEVEDSGDEWVRVITDEITGYVNERYLSEDE